MQQPGNHISRERAPRSLRETPLILLAGVAIFVVAVILLAGLLLGQDEPGSVAGGSANTEEPTATASSTPQAPTAGTVSSTEPVRTVSGSTGAVDQPRSATATVANTDAVAEPTATAVPASEPEPASTTIGTSDESTTDLVAILPGLEDLPGSYVVTNEGSLALDDLAALHPDPATQRQRLLEWGFTAAAERQFEPASGSEAGDDDLQLLATLVVEFRTPDGAQAAVEAAHADSQAAENTDVSNAEIEPLGDLSLAASGTLTIDGETLQIAYVIIQIGDRTITFAGGSSSGDPLPAVIRVASQTLDSP